MENLYLNARSFGAKGSALETRVRATRGQNFVTATDLCDFTEGDQVVLNGCFISYPSPTLFERRDSSPVNTRTWRHNQPLLDRVQLRGYDGSQGEWVVYAIDIAPEEPGDFRWTKNYGRSWVEDVPLSDGWIELGDGVSIKINDFKEREWGTTAVIICSSKAVTTIEKIEGERIYLADCPNKTCEAIMSHSDSAALQRAVDAAIEKKCKLFLPNGIYRLTDSIKIIDASSFVLEGESGSDTVLDNSFDRVGIETYHGSCFYINGGEEVTVKNLTMLGNLGFADWDLGFNMKCHGGTSVYAFYFHKTNASCTIDTKRVLFENCHARKMSGECFYSMGHARISELPHEKADPPDKYTRSLTYLRCSVEDCARNAFNNNDKAEGTSILYCRVKDVGNCMNEGSSRFIKIHGCYISNTASVATGNVRMRGHLERLGAAQHFITNNYFEGRTARPNEPFIKIGSYSTQVTVANNTFVNCSSPAIEVFGLGHACDTPPENVIITGNSIDLTNVDEPSRPRYGIRIASNYVTASDNHIFIRRALADENTVGIEISDNATRINVHDNTVTGMGVGIKSEAAYGAVGKIVSDTTFYRMEKAGSFGLSSPLLLRHSSLGYRGWSLLWLDSGEESEIAEFDPEKLSFTLTEPRELHEGDRFMIYGKKALPWQIHHNLIDSCATPLKLDTKAGERAAVEGNIIG